MLWHVFETHVMRLIIIIIKRAAFIEIGFMVMFCWFLKKKHNYYVLGKCLRYAI